MKRLITYMFVISISIVAIVITSCGTKKKMEKSDKAQKSVEITKTQGPPTIIYKTKKDYSNYVPVILSDDKTAVVSYPAPKDVYYKGQLAKPVLLNDGYLLDVRGISKDVAFTSITYEEYANLETTPSADSLMSLIIDNDPLIELYNCGNRYKFTDPVTEINRLIDNGALGKCVKEL